MEFVQEKNSTLFDLFTPEKTLHICNDNKNTINTLFAFLNQEEYIYQKNKFKQDSFFTIYNMGENFTIYVIDKKIDAYSLTLPINSITKYYVLDNTKLIYMKTSGELTKVNKIVGCGNLVAFGRFMHNETNLCLFGTYTIDVDIFKDLRLKMNNTKCPFLLNIQFLNENITYSIEDIKEYANKNKLLVKPDIKCINAYQ